MSFAGANRPCWIIRKGELMMIPGNKMPVGGFSIEKRDDFSLNQELLQPHDRLFLFTDGYADQFGGPKGKKFMDGNFRKLMLKTSEKPFSEQKALLEASLNNWQGTHEQVDDVLVIGVKI